jgi:hypothetical protein
MAMQYAGVHPYYDDCLDLFDGYIIVYNNNKKGVLGDVVFKISRKLYTVYGAYSSHLDIISDLKKFGELVPFGRCNSVCCPFSILFAEVMD